MKKILAGLLFMYVQLSAQGQFSAGVEGMWVASGTQIVIDSLSLEPTSGWAVSNNRLERSFTPVPGNPNASIRRVYQWQAPVTSASGRWGITYRTLELNGNVAAALQLAWTTQPDFTGFVTTSGSNVSANNVNNILNTVSWRQLTAVSANAILPVDILLFTAIRDNVSDRVVVRWVVADEEQVSNYAIQVAIGHDALNNGNFITLGNIPALNRPGEQTYTFNDDTPGKTGTRYYRLLIRDADGTFRYSIIRPVTFDTPHWQVYPNPFNNQFVLRGQAQLHQLLTWKLYDAMGRLVAQGSTIATGSVQMIPVDPGNIAAGVYFAEMTNGVYKENFRLIKR